jgi:hypothetical protein
MSDEKKRPGFWWMLFYGRRRRGFPWLLAGIVVAVVAFGAVFALPGGVDFSRGAAVALFVLAFAGAIVLAIVAVLRPRRRP